MPPARPTRDTELSPRGLRGCRSPVSLQASSRHRMEAGFFSVTASSLGVTSGPPSRPSPVFCQWAAGSWSRWSAAAGCSLELGSWKNRLSPGSSFTATCRDTVSRTWRNTLPSSPRKVGAGEGSRWPQSRTAAKALPSVEPSVPMLGSQFLQTSVPSSCCLGSLTSTPPGSGMRSWRRHGTGPSWCGEARLARAPQEWAGALFIFRVYLI